MRRKKKKKSEKTPKELARDKADSLLTPFIKKKYPRCLLCGCDTQVAHHHVHKSSSNRLRYDELNLIPLCNKCHCALHHNESYHASKVVEKKGMAWFKKLDILKRETVKTDLQFYEEAIKKYERMD